MVWWIAAVGYAEDSVYTTPQATDCPGPATHLSGQLGGSLIGGNASAYTLDAGLAASRTWKKNQLGVTALVHVGAAVVDLNGNGVIDDYDRGKAPDSPKEAGLVQNAQRASADLRYDRYLSDQDGVYALVGGYRDVYTGYDLRTHQQIGWSHLLLRSPTSEMHAELGCDFAQENYHPVDLLDPVTYAVIGTDDLPSTRTLSTRLLLAVSHSFNESVKLANALELYQNVRDTQDARILETASLTSALGKRVALQVSDAMVYDNLPVESYRPFDHTAMISLVANFL
jgi:putative salt-induced outer membrane protein YdiY